MFVFEAPIEYKNVYKNNVQQRYCYLPFGCCCCCSNFVRHSSIFSKLNSLKTSSVIMRLVNHVLKACPLSVVLIRFHAVVMVVVISCCCVDDDDDDDDDVVACCDGMIGVVVTPNVIRFCFMFLLNDQRGLFVVRCVFCPSNVIHLQQ